MEHSCLCCPRKTHSVKLLKRLYLLTPKSYEGKFVGIRNLTQNATTLYLMKSFQFWCLVGQNGLKKEAWKLNRGVREILRSKLGRPRYISSDFFSKTLMARSAKLEPRLTEIHCQQIYFSRLWPKNPNFPPFYIRIILHDFGELREAISWVFLERFQMIVEPKHPKPSH
jgi:hypothetical protein